jgi:endonuclease/exonuclease/phosphatase family metal-dependent hydrolase
VRPNVRALVGVAVGAVLVATPIAASGVGASGVGVEDPTPLCGSSKPTGAPAPLPGGLRVATFNVLHGLTDDGDRTLDARLGLSVNQLAASGVDIVGLQEAEESPRHGRVISRLAAGLAARTHQTWYWCWIRSNPHWPGTPELQPGGGNPITAQMARFANPHVAPWYEGAGVLSRYPIVASAGHRLPGENAVTRLTTDCQPPFRDDPTCGPAIALQSRAAVWARVKTSSYGTVSLTTAHTSGIVRQHRDLIKWARAQSADDESAFLVCDCNSLEDSPAQALIREHGWQDTARALHTAGPTSDQAIESPTATVDHRIDYVFRRFGSSVVAQTSQRFMNQPLHSGTTWLWPSDHWGVIDQVGPPAHGLPHTG